MGESPHGGSPVAFPPLLDSGRALARVKTCRSSILQDRVLPRASTRLFRRLSWECHALRSPPVQNSIIFPLLSSDAKCLGGSEIAPDDMPVFH